MATPANRSRKRIVHQYDPLDDLDLEIYDEPGHTRCAILDEDVSLDRSTAGFWADWLVQTINLNKISDELESAGAQRHFTIQAVLFSSEGDELLVTTRDGERFAIRYDAVMLDNVRTTRHG